MTRINIMKFVLVIAVAVLQSGVFGWSLLSTTTDAPGLRGHATERNKDTEFSDQANKIEAQNSPLMMPIETTDEKENQFSNSVFSRPRRSSQNLFPSHDFEGSQSLTPQQREYFLQIMSMLTSKESGYNQNKDRAELTEGDTDFVDEDEDVEPIELGYYGSNPYPFTSAESDTDYPPKSKQLSPTTKVKGNGGDAISIMRSRPPGELDDVWEEPEETNHHHHTHQRRPRSSAKLGLVNNGVSRYRKGEYNPFEHRIFTHHYQGLDKRNAKYFGSRFG